MSLIFTPSQRAFHLSSVHGGHFGGSLGRAQSVYGGAGGNNVRVSYASKSSGGFDLSGGLTVDNGFDVSTNEKATMQNLNDRLSNYMEKVRSLETANAQLDRQIREWCDKQTLDVPDYSKYQPIIIDLRAKINAATMHNAKIILQIDNAKLAAEDFKLKYENELAMRMSVEADIAGLRKVLDELTMSRSTLEMEIEGLKEELVYMKRNHEEELAAMRDRMKLGSVDVTVDAAPQTDLTVTIDEIRSQYETIIKGNHRDMETWYQAKFDEVNQQVASSTETLQTSRSEITELERSLQALQIELQSQLSLKAAVEGTLTDTEGRYSQQLCQLQTIVDRMECELTQVKADTESQANEYKMLLDIKTRLELEIAEYRRLLDGEDNTAITVINVVEEKKEVKKPVVRTVRKVVIEELVDGEVVSRHFESEDPSLD